MCGICGVSLSNTPPEGVVSALSRINAAQIARGPDGSGVRTSGGAGVGMVRLRVRADQDEPEPIQLSADQTAAYNGEVYWYAGAAPQGGVGEVRTLCRAMAGTRGAAEVDGMYAMVRFDASTGGLDAWRDPFGIKPLWSRRLPDGYAVASSIGGLLAGFGTDSPRAEAVRQFLAFGRVIDGGTLFQSISQVPRGSCWHLRAGQMTRVATSRPEHPAISAQKPDPQVVRRAVRESIRRVMPSNQTMGLAVSGGLDSSILAHQMAEIGIENLRTVSVLVEGIEDGVDDLARLRIPHAAARGWIHQSVTVTPEIFARGFERAVHDLKEPTRLSSVPLYGALADIARDSGIVVLQLGEGADELFMGYDSYRVLKAQVSDPLFSFLLPSVRHGYLEALYGRGVVQSCRAEAEAIYPELSGETALNRLRRIELDHSLEPLLRRADHILMARSIEGRTPFLHGEVPGLALGIDAADHLSGARSKPLLRAAFPEIDALEGPWRQKTPFRAPVASWLQTALRGWMTRVLIDGVPDLCALGLHEAGCRLVLRDALEGKHAALDMALALMSLVFWSRALREDWQDHVEFT